MKIINRIVDVVLLMLTLLTIVLLVVAWPARFGGSSSFVFVAGPSMEPTLHSEDLVIARKRSDIAIGDVIVYRVSEGPARGNLIVHRVIGGDTSTGLTTKGDNNPVPDPYHPTAKDVVGKVWVRSGHGHLLRRGLRFVVTPWLWAVFGTLVAFVLTWRAIASRESPQP